MSKKAVISIASSQMHDPKEMIEVVTVGEFIANKDSYEAKYEETEISGMDGTTTTLKIKEDTVILIREGSTSTTMEFKKNNNNVVLYNTPYGMLELKTATKDLKIDIDENGGAVFIDYNLIMNGQKPLNTKLKLDIKVHKN